MNDLRKIKRALISVSDKNGLAHFAKGLTVLGVDIISTGGTAKSLREAGLNVTDVSDVTGFPEMMDGRVKTLHPKIHGAFLALRDDPAHVAAMEQHSIEPIDLVVVNLYPFEQTVAKEGVSLEEAVENIDIGGPAMIRSASKNWRDVAVVTDPRLYQEILDEMNDADGCLSLRTRRRLAVLAYTRTASYDLAISSYLAKQLSDDDLAALEPLNPLEGLVFIETDAFDSEPAESEETLPERIDLSLAKITDLRYGENPHQRAALYQTGETGGLAGAEQLHGKEMSFNNYVDAEAAWDLVGDLAERAVAIIKHTNPSGVGVGGSNEEAYRRALSTDPVSAFGGIVAFNRKVDAVVASSVNEVFTEVVIAPDFDDDALEIFRAKKNLRILTIKPKMASSPVQFKQISGGMLVQTKDVHTLAAADLKIVTKKQPGEADIEAMILAWTVCKHVKSNAIVISNEHQTIGVGSGQMNRVDSIRIAAMRAERFGLQTKGAALASDAFFPFRDNVDEAAKLGIAAIIQPGGSIKDAESIEAADEHGIIMAFTGIRHFNH
ncbi:MAG: bifunctional phosphoribosylaminoimidazolecarboxamide formyltransferase/IMP cyclohydrolase [Acidobacteria bacterium]|nr:bifunctional phosphoribosylaminoimidazolecarboxamide formyltransferase/IMP cyclohydrolase [Acidobacteriota bacterium]